MTTIIVCNTCDESFEVTEETRLSDRCPICEGRTADRYGRVTILQVEGEKTNGTG